MDRRNVQIDNALHRRLALYLRILSYIKRVVFFNRKN